MRVGAVPADIGTREVPFLFSSLASVDRKSIDQRDLFSLHFPKATPSVFASGCPLMASIAPLDLNDLLVMGFDRIECRQHYFLSSDTSLHGLLEFRHQDHQELTCLQSDQDMCLLRGQRDHNNRSIFLPYDFAEGKDHEILELQSS